MVLAVGLAFGGRRSLVVKMPLSPAPLGSCLRRNDARGGGGRSPILTFPPRGKGYTTTLPLWIPAFAGMTKGVGRNDESVGE